MADEGSRGRHRKCAARADSHHPLVGFDDVPVAGDDQHFFPVRHDHHRVELSEDAVRAPLLGEFDGRPSEVPPVGLQLGFEAVLKRLGVGGGTGKAAKNLAARQLANLSGVVFENRRFPLGDLPVGRQGDDAVAADPDDRGGPNHGWEFTSGLWLKRAGTSARTDSVGFGVLITGGLALRGIGWTTAISYGGAALLSLLLVGRLAVPGAAPPQGLDLVLGAILLFFAGAVARGSLVEAAEANARLERRAKAAEELLVQQRNVVDDLADGLDVAVIICDPKATILYANRHSSELFRFSNPVGRTILTVTLSLDLEQLVLSTRESGEPQRREVQFTHPVERLALASAWPIDGGNRVIVSLYDITELRRLERIRSDFVSNVSHELRTPMASIRAMAETLLAEPRGPLERRQRYLERMISEVDRLSALTNDLLILSAAESNPVRKHTCDLAETVRSVVQQLEAKAHEKGLRLEYHGPKNLLIEANTSQLTQVAINLIDNAINYTNDGGVDVTIETDRESAVMRVADTGIGIASDHVPRIFERFYRVDKARSRSSGGTGLGLSIVKNIVEAHGGRVSLESALGKGSTFTVVLPIGDVSGPLEQTNAVEP